MLIPFSISSIAANGIKCYSCFSSKSFENYDGNKTEVIVLQTKTAVLKVKSSMAAQRNMKKAVN